jgi:hypothetical protein
MGYNTYIHGLQYLHTWVTILTYMGYNTYSKEINVDNILKHVHHLIQHIEMLNHSDNM